MSRLNRNPVFLFIPLMIFMILFVAYTEYDKTNYSILQVGSGHVHIPKRIAEVSELEGYDNYAVLKADDYLILAVGPDCKGVDDASLKLFDITNDNLEDMKSIKYANELLELVGEKNGNIIVSGKTDKPSYENFYVKCRLEENDEIIFVYKSENKTVIEIIIAPVNDISKSEINKMWGGIRYRK